MKTGIELITEERERQISKEGFTTLHDLEHTDQSILGAALCYVENVFTGSYQAYTNWPWDKKWFKPSTPIRDLVKAGALIAAEIDRLNAITEKSK